MKLVKLKPLAMTTNEIFVKPPAFLRNSEEVKAEKLKNCSISSMKDIKPQLQQRKLNKERKNNKIPETDEESVKKLSDWKRSTSPTTPLIRKYTFKRMSTMNSPAAEIPQKVRAISHAVTYCLNDESLLNALVFKVQGIISLERNKKKVVNEQLYKISKQNEGIEQNIKLNIFKLAKDIQESKTKIIKGKANLDSLKQEIIRIQKKHQENMKLLKLQEAEELLFKDKSKQKKYVKQGEEGQYLINKERMRLLRQEMHKDYQDSLEHHNNEISHTQKVLEINEYERQKNKKELIGLKEEIAALYLGILKEGKDLRVEGLRWVIKALWKLSQNIPISGFPKFIDEDSIFFLLWVSEKDLEYEYYLTKMEKMKQDIKNRRSASSISSVKQLYRSIQSRLRDISKSVISKPVDGRSTSELSQSVILENKDTKTYSDIVDYRNRLNQINDTIKEETEQEIKRITDIYQKCPGEAEKIGLFYLIKCLVGEKVREFNKYTRSQEKKIQLRKSAQFIRKREGSKDISDKVIFR